MWHNVTSSTAVSYSAATLSSESLPNDGESLISQRDFAFQNLILMGIVSVKPLSMNHGTFSLAFSRSAIHKSILEGWLFWKNWLIL